MITQRKRQNSIVYCFYQSRNSSCLRTIDSIINNIENCSNVSKNQNGIFEKTKASIKEQEKYSKLSPISSDFDRKVTKTQYESILPRERKGKSSFELQKIKAADDIIEKQEKYMRQSFLSHQRKSNVQFEALSLLPPKSIIYNDLNVSKLKLRQFERKVMKLKAVAFARMQLLYRQATFRPYQVAILVLLYKVQIKWRRLSKLAGLKSILQQSRRN